MKRNIVYSGIIAMLTYCLWGCEEEKTLQYVNNPAINFTGGTGLFSFIATPDLADTVLTVGLEIMGYAADVDREVNVEVLQDSYFYRLSGLLYCHIDGPDTTTVFLRQSEYFFYT